MTTDLKEELRDRIRVIVDQMLSGYDLESCTIEVRDDSDGNESIFVDLRYRLSPHPYVSTISMRLQSAVSAMLIENGEFRFPYIRHHFAKGQTVKAA